MSTSAIEPMCIIFVFFKIAPSALASRWGFLVFFMCVDAATRAANDFGYRCTAIHDACASRDLEFNGVRVPAQQAHTAYMASLGFTYANTKSTHEYLNSAS